MPVMHPTTIEEATALLAHYPGAMVLAGGTDAMVEINDGHRRPEGSVVVVNRIAALRSWRHDPTAKTVTVGAGVTYTELMSDPIASLIPALAEASRTVGSPQIRNAGTLGGNLGTSSPAGDGLPVLAALDAKLTLASETGTRTMAASDFIVGVKRTAIKPGELITEITLPVVEGWQGYAKVGVRNAMVIAVASVALVIDRPNERVAVALGSVGPTILRCPEAEMLLASSLDWPTLTADADALEQFATSVSAASRPITDHRSSAEYRRHAVGVLAKRLARRAGESS
ncbi:FAD binding domain-containing protein [uncultured Ilumatobacter sp.]|uniref:FAD binding domain-containing protein n=1 Tax=uncultured Ilumatobacter sp. TaxID=879968 RepID=UPI00374E7927